MKKRTSKNWRPVDQFPDYEINKQGVVRRIDSGRELVQGVEAGSLRTVGLLHPEGFKFQIFVHKAIWEAFKGPILRGLYVKHKNGDRSDNRLANLYLGERGGRSIETFIGRKPTDVRAVLSMYGEGRGPAEIARETGLERNHVKGILYRPMYKQHRARFEKDPAAPCVIRRPILSNEDAERVRKVHAAGVPKASIAQIWEVSPHVINGIVSGRTRCYATKTA